MADTGASYHVSYDDKYTTSTISNKDGKIVVGEGKKGRFKLHERDKK